MAKERKNANLHKAKQEKNDEFYTQLEDIELEMSHYRKHFIGKTIFCNCDDPTWSNFWRYFHVNFADLGLKKLVSTHYDREGNPSYMMEYTGGNDLDISAGVVTPLASNGDFRSEECVELLKQADIVASNPPFSLLREYVAQLIEYKKKFIIIGNQNAVTYKEIFPLIKSNQLWYGASIHSGDRKFGVPDSYPLNAAGCGIDEYGKRYIRVKGVRWFTNLDIAKRHIPFFDPESVHARYEGNEDYYPKYDNYDAINVDKTKDIPEDYFEAMGVPITFLDKYNPDDFDILDANDLRKDTVMVRFKSHGLIKDQEASITETIADKQINGSSPIQVKSTTHTHTHTHEQHTLGSASGVDVMAPGADGWHIKGKRKYARIFIQRKHDPYSS